MYAKSQAKCAFKWKPSDLQQGYESGVVSPFTLVAGINEDKDKSFPWIKASYFIPLAAVLKGESLWGKPYVAMTRYQLTFLTEYGIKGVLSGLMSSCTSISGTLTSNPSAHFADQYASNTSSAHFSDQYASNNPSAQLSDQYASNSSNTQMGTKEALASELIIVGSSTRGSGDNRMSSTPGHSAEINSEILVLQQNMKKLSLPQQNLERLSLSQQMTALFGAPQMQQYNSISTDTTVQQQQAGFTLQQLQQISGQLPKRSGQLYHGSAQLTQGSSQPTQGSSQPTQGSAQLTQGSSQPTQGSNHQRHRSGPLPQGSDQLCQGSYQQQHRYVHLPQGSVQLPQEYIQPSQGSNQQHHRSGPLTEGSSQLTQESNQQHHRSGPLTQGSSQLTQGSNQQRHRSGPLPQGSVQIPQEYIQPPQVSVQLIHRSGQLPQGSVLLPQGSVLPPQRSVQIPQEYVQQPQGSSQLHQGSGQLTQGSSQLRHGFGQLYQGSIQQHHISGPLPQGSVKPHHGSGQLTQGSSQLLHGSGQLYQASIQQHHTSGPLPHGSVQPHHGSGQSHHGSIQQHHISGPLPQGSVQPHHGSGQSHHGSGQLHLGSIGPMPTQPQHVHQKKKLQAPLSAPEGLQACFLRPGQSQAALGQSGLGSMSQPIELPLDHFLSRSMLLDAGTMARQHVSGVRPSVMTTPSTGVMSPPNAGVISTPSVGVRVPVMLTPSVKVSGLSVPRHVPALMEAQHSPPDCMGDQSQAHSSLPMFDQTLDLSSLPMSNQSQTIPSLPMFNQSPAISSLPMFNQTQAIPSLPMFKTSPQTVSWVTQREQSSDCETPLIKLFLSEGSAGSDNWIYWWIIRGPDSSSIHGPFSGEEMIIMYLDQSLTDKNLVCGSSASLASSGQSVPSGHLKPPSLARFQSVGDLLVLCPRSCPCSNDDSYYSIELVTMTNTLSLASR
eukprot:gene20399-27170_t